MSNIDFSIIIPTYNSEKTLRYTLESVKMQKYDLNKIECLGIDGGSVDSTLSIAGEYNFVRVLKNEKRLPEFAKLIGFNEARGRYIVKMDSDEAFVFDDVLSRRRKAFEISDSSHLLIADVVKYVPVAEKEPAGNYINACGDPFTYFIYRPKKSILASFKKNTRKAYDDGICMLEFTEKDKRPIADGGTTTFDREFIFKNFPDEMSNIDFICSVSDRILDITNNCLCIKDDTVFHRSSGGIKRYLSKIRFRIINNIFHKSESGFSSRRVSLGKKKFLFPLYTFSFILPLIDSLKLAFEYKDVWMLLHIFYCYYTCLFIIWYLILFVCKIDKTNSEY